MARLGVQTVIPHDVADSATHRSRTLRDLSQMDSPFVQKASTNQRNVKKGATGHMGLAVEAVPT